ncbi:NmrA family transcriptional regulator [Actinomadura sp. CNU-125]|uniref:SDR family oxidoreductase n=1 Tax=Actinomadura sp. CNU-125 TaxID=1904961 RepID=UPI000965BA6A|nr:NAD(P)H-binding protein [Actinomadura sp. CNU-125]OLT32569.1 NmrA family transcriptional regulator [Actinomadura sp. CNU-125]
MTSPILVTGGTGTLGSLVVPLLRDAGRPVRVLTRSAREPRGGVEFVTGDLVEDEGVDRAVEGVETVVHLAGGRKGDDEAARHLVRAAKAAGVRHLVYISVIGAGSVPLGYFRQKFAAERIVEESGVPWTTLRAAQFHGFVLAALQGMAKLPVMPAPRAMRWQPVDARDVAERLVELTLGAPAGMVRDLAGPTVYDMADLERDYLRASGKRRPLLPVAMPGKVGRAYKDGANLAVDGIDFGHRTWEDFLAEEFGARPARHA